MKFSRTKLLRRCLLSSALLASAAASSAADQSDNMGSLQGLNTGRPAVSAASAAAKTESTTVQMELQKLFQAGQVQTSQHQTAAVGSSVRLIQHESDDESPGLFRQIFGNSMADRRSKRLQERASRTNPNATHRAPSVPKPPPIDFAMQQRPAQQRASINARPVGFANEIPQPPGVPPVGVIPDSRVTLKPAAVDQFVSPFIDDESLERNSIPLDLDSLIDRPADRSEAMPITTDGDVVQRLVQLPIPMKEPAADPLLADKTVTLPAVDELADESLSVELTEETVDTDAGNDVSPELDSSVSKQSVAGEPVEMTVIQPEVAPTTKPNEASSSTTAAADSSPNFDIEDAAGVAVELEQSELTEQPRTAEVESGNATNTVEATASEDVTDEGAVDSVRSSIQEQNARRQQQRYLILSRAGRTGFKGFCPVALRETRMLRDSSKNHPARFGLKTYHFSSDDARLRFEADPARYAPAAGGSDVVLLANTGEETEGSLDFCLWYRDRLYMFRSRETQAIFSSDPARFANQY